MPLTISSKVLNKMSRDAHVGRAHTRALRKVRKLLAGLLCAHCPTCDGSGPEALKVVERALDLKERM